MEKLRQRAGDDISTHTYMFSWVLIHMLTCICTHIYTHTYTYPHILTHTHYSYTCTQIHTHVLRVYNQTRTDEIRE